MYRLLVSIFDGIDRGLDALSDGIRAAWRRAWDGPLQSVLFYLIIVLTGVRIILDALFSTADRALGVVERAIITVAMLSMVFLSFNDYLHREVPSLSLDVPGGANMALVLMVWVGFIGASLATRHRKHLAVDATDRILSPGAARILKRFTSFAAAGLCWMLARGSWKLMAESLEYEDSVEGLNVWEWLAGPMNSIIGMLPGEPVEGVAWPTVEPGGDFPLWLAQLILPVSFGLMAARFAGLGLFMPAPPPTDDDEDDIKAAATTTPAGPREPGNRTRRDVVFAGLFPGLLLGVGATLYFGTGGLILAASILLVLTGAPLFVAIGVAALSCALLIGNYDVVSVSTDMFEATKKHELLAIPFFVLAGNLMTKGSIADRLVGVARAAVGAVPGGLGLATIFSCVIFAAISGSSPVTVIAIGSIMFPMLVKEGYPERYSMGVLSTAGSLGIIIPPSVPMIVYAIVVSTPQSPLSPSDLFIAGVLPGLFMAAMLAIYTLYATRGVKVTAPVVISKTGEATSTSYFGNLLSAGRRGFLALMLPVLILGGIYGLLDLSFIGIPFAVKFTVTEAAAVAVVYALVVELFFHRELKWKKIPGVLAESGMMMGSLFLILVLAIAFNRFLTVEQVPQQAADWLVSHVDSKMTFIILVNIFLLLLGCVMDILSAILIVAPLLAPIAARFGLHPVHFAIMFIVNLEIGYLTPPMGINLFVASAVFKRSIVEVIRGVLPFLLLMLFCLAVISWFPSLSLALLE
ncbi:MAG: TRAP transporter large permease subunit [Myxococcota bacterium]|nr:TRAP transporter large permease subunit [Myxococcota bacterium]